MGRFRVLSTKKTNSSRFLFRFSCSAIGDSCSEWAAVIFNGFVFVVYISSTVEGVSVVYICIEFIEKCFQFLYARR